MLTNKQIATRFDLLARLMELHEENPFKIKSYANAYLSLRKLEGDIAGMSDEELAAIRGVGAAIAAKIRELVNTGKMQALTEMEAKTPEGIRQMLQIKGLGPKKVNQIWKEMGILTVGELLYACQENRLVHYKGFGLKVQDEIRKRIEYFLDSQGKLLYAAVEKEATALLKMLQDIFSEHMFFICGDVRRKMPEVCGIEIITDAPEQNIWHDLEGVEYVDGKWVFRSIPFFIYHESTDHIIPSLFFKSASDRFLEEFGEIPQYTADERSIFTTKGLPVFPPECREWPLAMMPSEHALAELIMDEHIKGIIHNHSTYSDGLHTLEEMASYVQSQGYGYFVISDHSRSAGYAGGLSIEQVYRQWEEVDAINQKYQGGFTVYKSIESDILTDGSLDYPDDVLAGFDLVIASVHSVLQMEEERATLRLIRAIEHPATRILGHPTGRLLLARPGYPVDYRKVIDACAANGVAIELNANPQRLDMDWTWIPYAQEKSVLVSINPDAHSRESIHYVHYGVSAARKGLLSRSACLNAFDNDQFAEWLVKGRRF